MDAKFLYKNLDRAFIRKRMNDDWSKMPCREYLTNSFKKKHMGLVLDNCTEIKQVYTAVFPSKKVIDFILKSNKTNVLLFTHHPMDWNLKERVYPFSGLDKDYLERLKKNKISLYTLHVPLDSNGPYSTSVNLAKKLGLYVLKEFNEYHGVLVGVICTTKIDSIQELNKLVSKKIGHKTKLYKYGSSKINNGLVAIVAGGGNDKDTLKELSKNEINTFITGITKQVKSYPPSIDAHKTAKKHKINLIGATHYSTEKFACTAMVNYFKKLGLKCSFIKDNPCMNDM